MARVASVLLAIAAAVSHVSAQDPLGTSNVTCNAKYNSWANNSLGQSPCVVAGKLVASTTCYDTAYNVDPLDKDAWYVNGDDPPACMCSDVAYNLFSACGDCQGHVWLDWAAWTANCTSTSVAYQGDIPADTEIPSWAQMNVETKGDYDPAAAQAFALAAASSSSASAISSSASVASLSSASAASASASSLSALTSSTAPVSAATGAPPGAATSSAPCTTTAVAGADGGAGTSSWSSTKSSPNVAAIAGGTLAGVVVLGGVAAIGLWLRRKQTRTHARAPTSYAPSVASTASLSLAPGMMSERPARASQLVAERYHDPGMPGAAPTDSYYGPSSGHPQRHSHMSYGTRPGTYTGAPEAMA